eukprot:TRINITY_DN4266_c0_g2_i2.p1 TRINITY_DN4266_c0_g2~~TRINITY_DN4266_c0_g2_i2.p1  ORF type:complete len:247 (-),score=14.59 TRINITY_DN4266_c0_g2_i2:353-1033(-)
MVDFLTLNRLSTQLRTTPYQCIMNQFVNKIARPPPEKERKDRPHMKSLRRVNIILLKDIEERGPAFSVIKVKPGYMRNWLYPQKKAVYATRENLDKYKNEIMARRLEAAVRRQRRTTTVEKLRNDLKRMMKTLSTHVVRIKFPGISDDGKFVMERPLVAEDVVTYVNKHLNIILPVEVVELKTPINQRGFHEIPLRIGHEDGTQVQVGIYIRPWINVPPKNQQQSQ